MEGNKPRPNKHICLTNRMPLGISSDPEADIVRAIDDPDVLTLIRGMTNEELIAPFTDGAFGMDERRVEAAVKRMKAGGLICSRRVEHDDGVHHHYYLNTGRLRTLISLLSSAVDGTEKMKSAFPPEERTE